MSSNKKKKKSETLEQIEAIMDLMPHEVSDLMGRAKKALRNLSRDTEGALIMMDASDVVSLCIGYGLVKSLAAAMHEAEEASVMRDEQAQKERTELMSKIDSMALKLAEVHEERAELMDRVKTLQSLLPDTD